VIRRLVALLCSLAAVMLLASCDARDSRSKRGKSAGQELFEEKCRTVAGERIYKTVPDVEGVLLLKVRPRWRERDLQDLMWPGAAFVRESNEHEYIESFLGYEHASSPDGKQPVSPADRGYITTDFQPRNPSNIRGYKYVDVIDASDGKRYRYSGSTKVVGKMDITSPYVQQELQQNPSLDMNVYRYVLERTLAPDPPPRYAVTYEDHVIPEERHLGVASSTVKVIDTATNEVLGEMTRYAIGATQPSNANPSPWLAAFRCPRTTRAPTSQTRQFVDQILIPRQEK
jgi:hypothetical protein